MSHLDKRFTLDQVKELLERYLRNEIERKYIQEILGIKRRRFFMLVKQCKENPQGFTIPYERDTPPESLKTLNRICLMLLTSCGVEIRRKKSIWRIVEYYLPRWRCDESYRYIKQ